MVKIAGETGWFFVTTKNGKSVNEIMIKEGYGWVDRFFLNQPELMDLQRAAESQSAGLWNKKEPMAPWIYDRIQIRAKSNGR